MNLNQKKTKQIDRISFLHYQRLKGRLGSLVMENGTQSPLVSSVLEGKYLMLDLRNDDGLLIQKTILEDNQEFQQWCLNFLNPLAGETVKGAKFEVEIY